MALAFDKKQADQRKEWITNWRDSLGVEDVQMQPISMFINHELILFSITNVGRSIPKLMDGFKESLRKIIHGAHLHWKIDDHAKEHKEFKIGPFGNYVATETSYHHGETILGDVITGMAQDFVGANNLAWFTKDGQLGTRFQGGKDAAQVRYTFTRPERLFGLILRKEDRPLLHHLTDDGNSIEPAEYFPVIPMVLVNGAEGIATGWSTTVPKHDPLNLIDWLRKRLQGKNGMDLPDIIPWYRGFTGTIKMIDRRFKKKQNDKVNVTTIVTTTPTTTVVSDATHIVKTQTEDEADPPPAAKEEDEEEEEGEDEDETRLRPLLSLITVGSFHFEGANKVIVTELPIGSWPFNYLKWLEELLEEGKIKNFRHNCNGDKVHFEIEGFVGTPDYRTLHLQRSIGMSNMVLLDENNRPRRYDTAEEIIEAFYRRRLPIYEQRKNYILAKLKEDIVDLNHKIRFVRAIISKEILVLNCKKADIRAHMERLGIPTELLKTTLVTNCTEDEVNDLLQDVIKKENQYNTIATITPAQMWLTDLDELEVAYCKTYSIKRPLKSETSPRLQLQLTGETVVQQSVFNGVQHLKLNVTAPNTTSTIPQLKLNLALPKPATIQLKIGK
jgi:DNA topoisomerase-2